MSFFSVSLLAGLTVVLSLGFVLFGASLVRSYRGIGVLSLGFFAIVWGGHFLTDATHVLVLSSYGVTSGTDLQSIAVSAPVELFLLLSTPVTGLLTVLAIFGWLWFVLSYTAKPDRIDEIAVLLAGGIVFLVTATNGLVGVTSSLGYAQLDPRLQSDFHRFAALIEVLGTGVGISAGIAQLYAASRRHQLFGLGAVVSLVAPVLLPYLVRYTYQFGVVVNFQPLGVLRAASLAIGLVGLLIAVHRYEIFDQLPASQVVGRETVFETTDTPILVLEAEDRIADLNLAAERTIGVEAPDVIGEPLSTVLPETVDASSVLQSGRTTFRTPDGDRFIEVQTTKMTDDRGREIGATVAFKDLTEERRRQQRIQVLNRVLRHNLRNDLTVGIGYVGMIEDEQGETEYTRELRSLLDELADVGEKARDLGELLQLEATVGQPRRLVDIADGAIETVRRDHDDVVVTTNIPRALRVRTNPDLLGVVLAELIENAVEHTDERVVDVRFEPDENAIVVRDQGEGIPDHEIRVFDSERETQLRHASGLGLWLVKWGVDRFGGIVDFETDDDGSQVNVVIPSEQIVREDPKQRQ